MDKSQQEEFELRILDLKKNIVELKSKYDLALQISKSSLLNVDFRIGEATVSSEFFQYLGFYKDEVHTDIEELNKLIHPDDLPLLQQEMRKNYKGETDHFYFEFRTCSKNNDWIWCCTSGKVIERYSSGEPIQVVGTVSIIDKRKKAELELLISETKYASIIQSSPMGIHTYYIDNSGKLIFNGGNPAADRLLKFNHNQIVGKTIEEAFPQLATTEIPEIYKSIALGGEPWTTENIDYDDGKINGAFEVRAFQTSPNNMAVYFLEISERKRNEALLKEQELILRSQNDEYVALNEEYMAQNEELTESIEHIKQINSELIITKNKAQESDKLKSAFLANMSHEIRTPMNAIVGFAELMVDTDLPKEKLEKYVQIINSNSHQLLNIINDIIDISKIEAGQVSLSFEIVNVNALLREMHSVFKTLAIRKNIEVVLHCPLPDSQASINTDETRLKQVLTNLLSNAIKFTQVGKVELGYKIVQNNVEFFVRDSGIGIAPEHKELIFERFRQVDSANNRKYGGTGLGLSITKALIELMGGKIWVESEVDKGTTFIFSLPYDENNNALNIEEPLIYTTSGLQWPDKTILVAEDEVANFFLIEEILSKTGVKILHASDGVEAVTIFTKSTNIDLVIMDIKMPNMNGYEATARIKALNPKIHIIAQTAFAMADDKAKAIASGCDSYIAKPIDKIAFLEIIDTVFKRKN